MAGKAIACVRRLTDDEQASLKKICTCGGDRDVPRAHALKLIDLGLAEVNCGELGATGAGKVALAVETAH